MIQMNETTLNSQVASAAPCNKTLSMSIRALMIVFVTCSFRSNSYAAEQPARPNLIFILADDLGYGELGCYGQTVIQTPRLDEMAKQGLRFTHFYAGATVCAPSRSVLMTGMHHGHTRVRGNSGRTNPAAQALQDGDVTVAKVLQQNGYRTALFGKWGLGRWHGGIWFASKTWIR